MRYLSTVIMILGGLAFPCASLAEEPPAGDERPLVMFIGDSLTVGSAGHPDQDKFPRWSYVDALRVMTDQSGTYRYDTRAAGGSSISGPYRALHYFAKGVTVGSRNRKPIEGIAFIVLQDSGMPLKDVVPDHMKPDAYESALREIIGFVEQRPGVKLILCTTAFERRPAGDATSDVWHKVNRVMLKLAKERTEITGVIRQDIYWQRYVDWYLTKKLPTKQERLWRLTGNGGHFDTVHPGMTGSVFVAMQMARELGIPAEKLNLDHPDLPISKSMAVEICDFVYAWKEPTIVPLTSGK